MGSSVDVSPPASSLAAGLANPTSSMKFTVVTAACAWALMTATRGPPSIDSKSMLCKLLTPDSAFPVLRRLSICAVTAFAATGRTTLSGSTRASHGRSG